MDKKKISIILILLLVSLSLLLLGCKVEKIQFNRESQAQNLLNKISNPSNSTQIRKSSGMIIIKNESNNNSNTIFGPSDIKFDLPSNF